MISSVRSNRLQSIAQGVNFQLVKQRVNGCRVPSNPNRISGCDVELDIVYQSGQRTVQLDRIEMTAQRFAYLALYLIGPSNQFVNGTKLQDPFGRRLFSHTGNAGQIVRWISAKRR